jgi:hypothetical protein
MMIAGSAWVIGNEWRATLRVRKASEETRQE